MKRIRYLLEAAALYVIFTIFRLLPLRAASALGGFLGRYIGPLLGASGKALRHIRSAFPEMGEDEAKAHIHDMWENLGRVLGEYPHLEELAYTQVTLEGREIAERLLADGQGAIFCGAHIGNWEIPGAYFLTEYDQSLSLTYRALNNPYADRLLLKARTLGGKLDAFPKARESGRDLIKTARNKGFLGILIDQKYNEGVAVPFFGMDAMTNPIAVELAQKTKSPLVMVQNKRLGGTQFVIRVHEPLALFDGSGNPRPTADVLRDANAILESWIREAPGQWLWLHRRWGDSS
jgi:KDO2-lipid IV(A) lauroyltransferase